MLHILTKNSGGGQMPATASNPRPATADVLNLIQDIFSRFRQKHVVFWTVFCPFFVVAECFFEFSL